MARKYQSLDTTGEEMLHVDFRAAGRVEQSPAVFDERIEKGLGEILSQHQCLK